MHSHPKKALRHPKVMPAKAQHRKKRAGRTGPEALPENPDDPEAPNGQESETTE